MIIRRRNEPVSVGGVEIESTDRIHVQVEQVSGRVLGVAWKEPVSVTVRTPAGTWSVDLEGHEGAAWDDAEEP